jgi:hypothetical protein
MICKAASKVDQQMIARKDDTKRRQEGIMSKTKFVVMTSPGNQQEQVRKGGSYDLPRTN